MTAGRPGLGAVAALVFNPALGSLYAWSVFVPPLEIALQAPRADISAIFAVAVVGFTCAMVAAPFVYRRASAAGHLLGCGAVACLGLLIAAAAESVPVLLLGYGVIFGLGAGYGYSITLQLIVLALAPRAGLATGLGVGSFAAGSILLAVVFSRTVAAIGPFQSFALMAALMAIVAVGAASLARASGLELPSGRGAVGAAATGASFGRVFPLLWLGFFLGAFAGVMSIGHATGIVASHGGGAELALLGTIVINIGNAGGRIVSGWLAEHIAPPRVAAASHLSAAAGFALILTAPGPTTAVVALGLQGLAYGLASGGYPAAIGIYFGLARYGRYLGFLITAWGVAGLTGPWLAGRLYDLSGGYEASETIGLVVVLAALALTFAIPRPNASQARASS